MKIINKSEDKIEIKEGGKIFFIILTSIFLTLSLIYAFGLKHDFRTPLWVSFFILSPGIWAFFKAKESKVIFDKKNNRLSISENTLIKVNTKLYYIDEIKEVKTQRHYLGGGNWWYWDSSIILLLKNGERVELPSRPFSYLFGMPYIFLKVRRNVAIAKEISSFINVPFTEDERVFLPGTESVLSPSLLKGHYAGSMISNLLISLMFIALGTVLFLTLNRIEGIILILGSLFYFLFQLITFIINYKKIKENR